MWQWGVGVAGCVSFGVANSFLLQSSESSLVGSSAVSANSEISGSPKWNEVRLWGELADQYWARQLRSSVQCSLFSLLSLVTGYSSLPKKRQDVASTIVASTLVTCHLLLVTRHFQEES